MGRTDISEHGKGRRCFDCHGEKSRIIVGFIITPSISHYYFFPVPERPQLGFLLPYTEYASKVVIYEHSKPASTLGRLAVVSSARSYLYSRTTLRRAFFMHKTRLSSSPYSTGILGKRPAKELVADRPATIDDSRSATRRVPEIEVKALGTGPLRAVETRRIPCAQAVADSRQETYGAFRRRFGSHQLRQRVGEAPP